MLPPRSSAVVIVALLLVCAATAHPKDKRPHLADILQAAVASDGDFSGVRAARASKYEEEPLLDDDYPNDETDGGLGNLWTTEPPFPLAPLGNATNETNLTTTLPPTQPPTTLPPPTCETIFSPMADEPVLEQLFGYAKVAPVGSACVFGVDTRDERSHCIMSDGQYGVNGWCYTKADGSEWGSCSAGCPLFGQAKVLSARVQELNQKLEDAKKKLIPALEKAVKAANQTGAPVAPGKGKGAGKGKATGKGKAAALVQRRQWRGKAVKAANLSGASGKKDGKATGERKAAALVQRRQERGNKARAPKVEKWTATPMPSQRGGGERRQ